MILRLMKWKGCYPYSGMKNQTREKLPGQGLSTEIATPPDNAAQATPREHRKGVCLETSSG